MPARRRAGIRTRPADNHLSAAEWEQVRHLLKTRSGGFCEARGPQCGYPTAPVPDDRAEVQHRRAQGMGGSALDDANSLANLLWLCGPCHRWVETRPDGAEARGLWLRHEYDDGEPVAVHTYPLVLFSGRRVLLHPTAGLYERHPDEWGLAELLSRPAG